MELKEYGRAVVDLDEAIRIDEANGRDFLVANTMIQRARVRLRQGRYSQALADVSRATQMSPQDARAPDLLARILATCPEAEYRDGDRAVNLAVRACELTAWKDPAKLNTLAAAKAESGDFEAAIIWQTRANPLFNQDKDTSDGLARLRLYRSRLPYRETKPK